MNTLWIALLEVEPLPNTGHDDIAGAHVWGVVPAISAEDAKEKYRDALKKIDFILLAEEELEEFELRIIRERKIGYDIPEELKRIAHCSRKTGLAEFSNFHCWPKDDE